MAQSQIRSYKVDARSTDTFGRVLCTARNHHFIVDGPVQNGCPGEAVNPGELFLAGVAASSGSACASGSLDPSHVLLAMGLNLEQALGSLRLTTGYATTDEEIAGVSEVIRNVLKRAPAHA